MPNFALTTEPMTITCYRCRETKPLSDFGNNRNKKNGKHSWCKQCVNQDRNEKRRLAKMRGINDT